MWVDFYKDSFSGMDVDLKEASLVEWRVEQGKEALKMTDKT